MTDTSKEAVYRFALLYGAWEKPDMLISHTGEWVGHYDYKTLAIEHDALQATVKDMLRLVIAAQSAQSTLQKDAFINGQDVIGYRHHTAHEALHALEIEIRAMKKPEGGKDNG